MKRKILSLILVFAMTVSLLTVGTGAVEPTYGDTAGHWAESSIERWSGHGIVQGSNGLFDPNGQLTCAQLATILAKLLKLPAAKDAGFTDNTADAWYYDAINRCAAAGILNGNGDGTVTPEAPITRERAMVMLARALGIEPIRKPDLTKYTDAAQVSAYAQGYVAALIEAGIVGGVTADELAPQDNINRASTVTILDRAIGTYADKAGATVKADGKGLVLVVAENVKITGAPEGTKIVVADGATGLSVNGKAVSAGQTYIVPKTEPAKPSSSSSGGYSHSHSYVYTDNGDGTHTGRCYANDSTLAPEAHNIVDGKCTVCGAAQTAESVASVKAADGSCTYYSTLPEAVAAATDGATITLLNEQDLSANLVFSTKVTLNLNGQAVETKGYAIQVQGSGDLTVTGNGTVNNDQEAVEVNNKKNYRTIFSVEGETAKLTIENGTFTTKASQAIFAEGTVTIHDGTFQNTAESVNEVLDSSAMITANGSAAAVTIYKASVIATAESTNAGIYGIYGANGAHITLKDGVEVHTSFAAIGMNNTTSNPEVVITVTGGTFSSDPTAYVADGYFALPNGDGTYTVVTADQITSGVTIKGIAGYEHRAFATVADAYSEINPKVAALGGLGQETCSKEAFDALYTDDAKITWTIYGKQALVAGSEGKDAHTFTFGRAASYYRNDCNIAAIIVKGGNDSAALDLSATGGTFALPYNWWGENIKNCEVSFTGITFDGVKSIPSTWASQVQSTPYTFDRCTFNGSVYGYHDYNINLTIQNSTFNAPENTGYAVTLQSETGINGTVTLDHNTFNGYTRGVNLQRPGTDFIFTNNTITSTVSKPDRAAIQLTDGKSFTVTGNTVRVNAGNAFWFHSAATNEAVTYEISNNNIQAPYIGYSAASFDVNPKITSSGNKFNNTDTTKCMKKGATVAEATNLTAIH